MTAVDIQEDLEMIRSRLADEFRIAEKYGTGSWALFRGILYELSQKGMRNRLFLVFCAFALQNMSGAAAINYYSPTLFASIGISDVSLYTGIYGLVKGKPSRPSIQRKSVAYNNSGRVHYLLRPSHRPLGQTISNYYFVGYVLRLLMDSWCICQNWSPGECDFCGRRVVAVDCSWWQSCNCHDHDIFRVVSNTYTQAH